MGTFPSNFLRSAASFTNTENSVCVSGSLGIKVSTGVHVVVKELFGSGLLPVNCDLAQPGGRCALSSATAGALEVTSVSSRMQF